MGRRPGPPLWRVVNGDNTLYVFAMLSPLPRDFAWDSSALEHLLGEATLFLGQPTISAGTANPFKAMGFVRQLGRLKRLDEGSLYDLTGPELANRVKDLAAAHGVSERKLKRLKPLFAAEYLSEQAAREVGFAEEDRLSKQLRRLVDRSGVEIVDADESFDLDEALEVLQAVPLEDQLACLQTTVDALADDVAGALARAEAWMAGDASALRQMAYPDATTSCSAPVRNVAAARAAVARAEAKWIGQAEGALKAHTITVAALPVAQIMQSDGLIERLAERGYAVHGQ